MAVDHKVNFRLVRAAKKSLAEVSGSRDISIAFLFRRLKMTSYVEAMWLRDALVEEGVINSKGKLNR